MKQAYGLCAVMLIASMATAQKQHEDKNTLSMSGAKGQYEIEEARVVKVFTSTKEGYRFVAYLIDWHGEGVVVSDPLAQSTHRVG